MALRHWSQTASGNAAPPGINWAEGQAPSTVNNSSRETMAQVRQVYTPDHWQWVDVSATASIASQTVFKVATDLTGAFTANRRFRLRGGSTTRYGTIVSATFGAETTVTVTVDSGSLSASHTIAAVAALTDDGVPRGTFARLASTNTFTSANLFQATTTFSAVAVFQGGMSVSGAAIFSDAVVLTEHTLTFSTTVSLDGSLSNNFILSVSGSCALATPNAFTLRQKGQIILDQNGTGGFSVSLASAYVTEGGNSLIIDTAANARTVIDYVATSAAELLVKIAWKEGRNTIGHFREYDKGTLSFGGAFQQLHGLGRYPAAFEVWLENLITDDGYAVGDRVKAANLVDEGGGDEACTEWVSAATVGFSTGNAVPNYAPKAGGTTQSPLASSWKVIFRVYE